MEPETPGITIVAEDTIPRRNKTAMFPAVTGIEERTSSPSLTRGSPAETAKARKKARTPTKPIPRPDRPAFLFMAPRIVGIPPRISPTKAMQVTKVCLLKRYSTA